MADDVIKTLLAEAYGEGPEAMRRVAEVILNRAATTGKTPEQVVRQAHQFTGLTKPGSEAKKTWTDPKAISAAQAAWDLAQQPGDPTGGADHYHTNAVNPAWASKMPSTGEYGSHKFYASRPIPPGSLPEVATLTDTVPSVPLPVTASPNLAQMRATPREMPSLPLARPQTAPSNLISQSMASLPRPTANLGDSIAMSPIPGGKTDAPMYDAAFDSRTGEMRLTRGGPYMGFGNDVGRSQPPAPIPASAEQRVTARNNNLPPMPARLPDIPASTLGQSPATRTVQSLPVPSARSVPGNSFAGMERAPVNALPAMGTPNLDAIYAGIYPSEAGDFRIGGNAPNLPTTAPSSGMSPARVAQIGVGLGNTVNPVTRQRVAEISLPRVASQLDVGVPLPRARPNIGMGGVDVTAQVAPRTAPLPAPRLERGGIFGNPKIGNWEVPLPGVFGVLQNATKAMNNASGPFNNGGDNALYNLMRGGDFNTPGAATAQAGGFLFAPKDGGGWLNVGRAPNYAQVNGGGSSSGSGGGGMSSVRGENRYDPDTNSWSRK